MANPTTALTFSPKGKNKYRCNQTGDIVKQAGIDAYKKRMLNKNKQKVKLKSKEFRVYSNSNSVSCPKCKKSIPHDYRADRVRCPDGHMLMIINNHRIWFN